MAKHGGAPEREALVKEVLPRLLELAKNPYGHFLVSKLLALAPKPALPGAAPSARGCRQKCPHWCCLGEALMCWCWIVTRKVPVRLG